MDTKQPATVQRKPTASAQAPERPPEPGDTQTPLTLTIARRPNDASLAETKARITNAFHGWRLALEDGDPDTVLVHFVDTKGEGAERLLAIYDDYKPERVAAWQAKERTAADTLAGLRGQSWQTLTPKDRDKLLQVVLTRLGYLDEQGLVE